MQSFLYVAYLRHYSLFMLHHGDAIFSHGAFHPLELLEIPEGARVRLTVEQDTSSDPSQGVVKVLSPKFALPGYAHDFVMEVRETGDAPA
jgi:predicted DNA-binding antitoxin AbrB/MazE fold protein